MSAQYVPGAVLTTGVISQTLDGSPGIYWASKVRSREIKQSAQSRMAGERQGLNSDPSSLTQKAPLASSHHITYGT